MIPDNLPVYIREPETPEENKQFPPFFDFGDRNTWIIIGLMFLFGLLVAGLAWFMPYGQHATQPTVHLY
jgi:hypothetical protein